MIVQFRRVVGDTVTLLKLVPYGKTYALREETEKEEFLRVFDFYLNTIATEDSKEYQQFVEQTDDMIPMIRNIMVAGTIVSDYFEQVLCTSSITSAEKR